MLPFSVRLPPLASSECSLPSRSARAATIGLLVLIPLHFLFFEVDYFGDYHRRVAFWFDWNHRGGLEEIIAREAGDDRPIFLSNGSDAIMAAYWRFAVLKHHRQDLLGKTVYFDAKTLEINSVPDRALILMSRDDGRLVAMVRSGQLTELASIPEPADPPYYAVVERRH